jgi:glucose/arabinose dehydrogenase
MMARCAILVFLAFGVLFGGDRALAKAKVEGVYRAHCASCHGVEMQGGSGGQLLEGIWKYGASDAAVTASIAAGISDAGMPAFGQSLSPETIRSLVVYIREKEKAFDQTRKPSPPKISGKPVQTKRATYMVEPVVAGGLETPWALAFLPDGRKLVTERIGRLRILDHAWKLDPKPVRGTPAVLANGQGGLMDVAPAPDAVTSRWIYLSFSAPATDGTKSSMTKIVRGKLADGEWIDEKTIFETDPKLYTSSGVHFGSRIVFNRGHVFFSTGDRGEKDKAQDIGLPNGKIYRVLPDGKIPTDNPFTDRQDALAAVWSYGHRNPQGLVVDPRNQEIYETEHGPRGGDEFNLIRKGANYGWPLVCFGMNYDGTPLTALTEKDGIDPPLHHWTPSIAVCGLAYYDGDEFPEWKNDFFAGGLRGELHRLRLQDGKVIEKELVLEGIGRVRDVRCGPDGLIYVVLNDPDIIVRLVPAKPESGSGG